MGKLKNQLNSVSFKIWRLVMGILLLFVVSIALVNVTFLRDSKENFIYQQLRASAEAKKSLDTENSKTDLIKQNDKNQTITEKVTLSESGEKVEEQGGKANESNEEENFSEEILDDTYLNEMTTTYINHFVLFRTNTGYQVRADGFTSRMYFNASGHSEVIEKISQTVINGMESGELVVQGKLELKKAVHYYYIDYSGEVDHQMIFLTSIQKSSDMPYQYGFAVLLVIIASFFASKLVTRQIVRPIQALESFAEEVALHHWDVKTPTSETTEIHQLAVALDRMKQSLKITEEREQQFLQSSSHNLKTPVMVIKGYAQAIMDGINLESKSSAAEVIRQEAECLERRIVQMLKLSTYGHSLERSQRNEIIRLDRLIKSLVAKFQMVRPELNWKIELVEIEVMGNSDALLTAIENLVENQLRFAKSVICIKMKIENQIVLEFSNDGPPFEAVDPMLLFERYKKDKEGKFGLGLAIVKQIIEGHEGSISASNCQEGVCFKVLFPLTIQALPDDKEME